MKKMLLAVSLLAATGAFAQTTVTFDDLTLAAESYYDGSDGAGSFVSGGITFPNEYNDQFNYWSGGFIYSNTTDVTTAGYTNDFSAFAGSGSSSANYGVNYGGGSLDLGSEKVLASIDITNTTYAALSMRDGDSFGKQFGSSENAQGSPDGTNGEDFFRLLITGYDANYDSISTVIVYLADYRFADNNQDYILDTWETVDLSVLGAVQYLDFALESSDVGDWGMNTPAYFALDNLVYGSASVKESEYAAFDLFPNPATENVTVRGEKGTLIVRNMAGAIVYRGATEGIAVISTTEWTSGFYIVEFSGETGNYRSSLVKR